MRGRARGLTRGRQKAATTGAPQVSKIAMMRERCELTCQSPRRSGKFAALWIARYDVIEHWIHGGWSWGAKTAYELGMVRTVVTVYPDAQQTAVEPTVAALPYRANGVPGVVPRAEALRVVTRLLAYFHKAMGVYEAIIKGGNWS